MGYPSSTPWLPNLRAQAFSDAMPGDATVTSLRRSLRPLTDSFRPEREAG
jgi:hypothetical protein